jgi:hypothetical protein
MCFELQRRLKGRGVDVTVTPLAPGFIGTAIASSDRGVDHYLPNSMPPEDGAATTLHALLDPDMAGESGFFLQPYAPSTVCVSL